MSEQAEYGPLQELRPGVTLYLPPDVDREQVGRLVKAMCSLNGITVAIELHPAPSDGGGSVNGRIEPNTGHLHDGARITMCPSCGGDKWAYIGGDLDAEPPCYACNQAATGGNEP